MSAKRTRAQCDAFLCGYLDAALFTTDTHPPAGQDYVESGRADEMFEHLPEWFIAEARKACADFVCKPGVAALLAKAGDHSQNGADLWYTRNGHGVGFWDRGYPDEIAKPLTDAAHAMGEHYLLAEDIGQTEGER